MRRTPFTGPLSNETDRRLSLYSAAAIAAGVSVLALVRPASGEVVVTKKNITLTAGTPVSIDLNHDGIADFSFSIQVGGYGHSFIESLIVSPLAAGQAVGTSAGTLGFGPYASALLAGAKIGPSAHFVAPHKGHFLLEQFSSFQSATIYVKDRGKWDDLGPNRYLGVKFKINGATHFGWVRMTVNVLSRGVSGTITAFAYETVAGKAIEAGHTSDSATTEKAKVNRVETSQQCLGSLALGADGLTLWRREAEIV